MNTMGYTKSFKCGSCGQVFKTAGMLKKHRCELDVVGMMETDIMKNAIPFLADTMMYAAEEDHDGYRQIRHRGEDNNYDFSGT